MEYILGAVQKVIKWSSTRYDILSVDTVKFLILLNVHKFFTKFHCIHT